MASDKLPPLDLDEDKQYDPYCETTKIDLKRCKHKDTKIINGQLRCKCGVGWSGFRLQELQELLSK
jgi:hypothetical protein